jgi:hypothetical protein
MEGAWRMPEGNEFSDRIEPGDFQRAMASEPMDVSEWMRLAFGDGVTATGMGASFSFKPLPPRVSDQ